MESNSLKIYPSGFLGSPNVQQTEPQGLIATAKQMFNRAYIPNGDHYTASIEVLELWTVTVTSSDEFKEFSYKERILKCALTHFGTDSILDWILSQAESPEFGDSHSRWIDETLEFVFEGKKRNLGHNGWRAILTAGGNDVSVKSPSKVVKEHFMRGSLITRSSSMSIRDFITVWVRQTNGIEDLMSSLYVLFGPR